MSTLLKPGDSGGLYPDVVAAGGLRAALQAGLEAIGSPLRASELDQEINFVAYARVESGSRFSQVYIAAEERLFVFDCWNRGVCLANGRTSSLEHLARALDRWLISGPLIGSLAAEFEFVVPYAEAGAYERGEEVEHRWQKYLSGMGDRIQELVEGVEAAAGRRELRGLFPYTSLNMLCFSRCTGYPFTDDTPHIRPLPGGGYEVIGPDGRALGRGDGEVAAALVVAHLPASCGPAVPGTVDDLPPA